MRTIKFKRVFQQEETGYITMIIWGNVNHKDNPVTDFSCFKSPSSVHRYYPIADLQFTGLTDKNGIEIFEGDVVSHEYESEYGPVEHRDVVEYLGGAFYPICEKPENEFEVIGNIYETPEILKS